MHVRPVLKEDGRYGSLSVYDVTLCTQVETDIHLHHLILLLIMPSECVLSCYHESAELVCACCCSYTGCVPN